MSGSGHWTGLNAPLFARTFQLLSCLAFFRSSFHISSIFKCHLDSRFCCCFQTKTPPGQNCVWHIDWVHSTLCGINISIAVLALHWLALLFSPIAFGSSSTDQGSTFLATLPLNMSFMCANHIKRLTHVLFWDHQTGTLSAYFQQDKFTTWWKSWSSNPELYSLQYLKPKQCSEAENFVPENIWEWIISCLDKQNQCSQRSIYMSFITEIHICQKKE